MKKTERSTWLIVMFAISVWFVAARTEELIERLGTPLPDWTSYVIFSLLLATASAVALFLAMFRRDRD